MNTQLNFRLACAALAVAVGVESGAHAILQDESPAHTPIVYQLDESLDTQPDSQQVQFLNYPSELRLIAVAADQVMAGESRRTALVPENASCSGMAVTSRCLPMQPMLRSSREFRVTPVGPKAKSARSATPLVCDEDLKLFESPIAQLGDASADYVAPYRVPQSREMFSFSTADQVGVHGVVQVEGGSESRIRPKLDIMTIAPECVGINEEAQIEIAVRNNGATAVTGVRLRLAVNADARIVASEPAGKSLSPHVTELELDVIPAGESMRLKVAIVTYAGGAVSLTCQTVGDKVQTAYLEVPVDQMR